ncbi:MAG TPA: hypothetical protein VHX60_09360 [Acidobacteriaceae bacterium]|jgi:hypothetical protein|nr:hypothetical protein [Acidobacteriaceae bacterium]
MNTIRTSQEIDHGRRRFLGAAAMTVVSANFGMAGPAEAQSSTDQAVVAHVSPPTSFGPLKQIPAGLLSVGYAEAGLSDGPP